MFDEVVNFIYDVMGKLINLDFVYFGDSVEDNQFIYIMKVIFYFVFNFKEVYESIVYDIEGKFIIINNFYSLI